MREEVAPGAGVATTAAATGCSAVLFIIGLALAAFITRDSGGRVNPLPQSQVVDAGLPIVPVDAPDAIDADAVISASLALEPALLACFKEAHARDPSAGRRATVQVQVRLGAQGPELVGGKIMAAPSPFFRPCMQRQARLDAPDEGSSRVLIAEWDGDGVRLSVANDNAPH
jgi:hypothetical protein